MVLVAPKMPWNIGDIGCPCPGAGTYLDLIKPLGFSLGDKELKHVGLDYWHPYSSVIP